MSTIANRRTASRVARALLLATATACAGAILAQPAFAASGKTRTLVVKEAHNPVFRALKRVTKLRLDRTPPRPGKGQGKHDMVVLDGDALSARRMARRRELHKFANTSRWVLALDLGSGHHRKAIARHTGFETLAEGRHTSRSFLFRHAEINGIPQTVMLDTPRVRPSGTHSVKPRKRRKSTKKEARRVARLIADRLEADSDEELARVAGLAAPAAPTDPPDEALVVAYPYTQTGSLHPKNGNYECGDPGYQTATWTMNHTFTVYLDNSVTHPQGDFQIVTYDLNGTFNPVGQGAFYNMDQTCTLALGAKVPRDRSWWTGAINPTVAPDAPTDAKLSWQANQPNTPNQEGTASSEETFTVGIAAEGTEGSVNLNYTADHGRSFSIPDWGVGSDTSGNRVGWLLSSRNKCDPRPDSDPHINCFGDDVRIGFPNYPNDLSRRAMQVNASARWRTKSLLAKGNGQLTFNVGVPVDLVDLACTNIDFNSCLPDKTHRTVDYVRAGTPNQAYSFNASDAIPVEIESVEVKPTTANGAKNEKVTGTVTLASATPFKTRVVMFSSRENAFLGTPVTDQISKGTVTINKGDTKGTIEINTNDNHLASGRRVTAYITAFYAEAADPVPLIVQSQP